MKKKYEPQSAKYNAHHNVQAEADEAVFRTILDSVEGETMLYADDDPLLKDFAGKQKVHDTALSEHDSALSGKLDQYCSEQNLPQSSLFMSAYAYMLHLFCGQKDVLFFAKAIRQSLAGDITPEDVVYQISTAVGAFCDGNEPLMIWLHWYYSEQRDKGIIVFYVNEAAALMRQPRIPGVRHLHLNTSTVCSGNHDKMVSRYTRRATPLLSFQSQNPQVKKIRTPPQDLNPDKDPYHHK